MKRSDIVRYEILHAFGGLYIDTDFECLKSFDILHHCYTFYIGTLSSHNVGIGNGIIGSVAGHPLLRWCIEN